LVDGFGDASLYERWFGGSGADDPAVVIGVDGRVQLVDRWTDAEELDRFLKRAVAD
jgi:hypothetical protein